MACLLIITAISPPLSTLLWILFIFLIHFIFFNHYTEVNHRVINHYTSQSYCLIIKQTSNGNFIYFILFFRFRFGFRFIGDILCSILILDLVCFCNNNASSISKYKSGKVKGLFLRSDWCAKTKMWPLKNHTTFQNKNMIFE